MSTKNVIKTVVFGVLAIVSAQACTDAPGDDAVGSVESEVALAPPTNLQVVNVRSDRQDLTWTVTPGTDRHIILRGILGPGSEKTYTTCCIGTTNTFIANHLTPNTNYCWEVQNLNAAQERSAPSNEVCLTTPGVTLPSPPLTVNATAISASRIDVDWSAVAGATKYHINESVSGGPFTQVAVVSGSTLTLQRANLTAATTYCYTVQTENAEGIGAPSAQACATTFLLGLEGYWKFDEKAGAVANDSSGFGRNATLANGAAFSIVRPKPPIDDDASYLNAPAAGGAATTAAASAFRLTGAFSIVFWANTPTATSDAKFMGMHNAGSCGPGALGWEISQTASGLSFISQTATKTIAPALAANTWTHIGVTYAGGAGGTMTFYINGSAVGTTTYTASNSLTAQGLAFGHVGGCGTGQVLLDEVQLLSRVLSAAEVALVGQVPPPPTGLMITKNVSTVQNLAWTAPAGVTERWIIMRAEGAPASGNEVPYTHAPNPPTTFNGDHLLPSTEYAWQVLAVQNGLISPPSNEVVATTADPPAAPQNLTATAISNTRIRLDWQASPTANKYFIQISTDGTNFTPSGSVLAPAVTFTRANLTPNTLYFFRVQAEDLGLVKSAFSNIASAMTPP